MKDSKWTNLHANSQEKINKLQFLDLQINLHITRIKIMERVTEIAMLFLTTATT